MPEGVPPFATYVPGADSAQNGARAQAVRAVTIHTTEGPDSRGIGQSRHHNTPGTFNFLNRDDGLYCYYPAHVRCSHAAGANQAGPGIENEGHTGTPLTPNQIANLGRLAHWLSDTYGVPLTYRTGDPREWIDNTGFRGFIAHRAVDYPPNTSYRHHDEITPAEWAAAVGSQAGPVVTFEEEAFMLVHTLGAETYYQIGEQTWTQLTPAEAYVLATGGAKFTDLTPQATQVLQVRADANRNALRGPVLRAIVALGQFVAKLFPKKAGRAGGAPTPEA